MPAITKILPRGGRCHAADEVSSLRDTILPDDRTALACYVQRMTLSPFRIHALIIAAYILAAILPALSIAEGLSPAPAGHAAMMAMAGHVAPMDRTDSTPGDPQMMLCQQHCLFAAATMPQPDRATGDIVPASASASGGGRLAASLAIPPPGHPPKIAAI
ncbi:MAG: hypothetical protein V4516_03065 [Pseudomonadota bacterium]